jgi:multicomponent Na+:H+ antiporter subunit C
MSIVQNYYFTTNLINVVTSIFFAMLISSALFCIFFSKNKIKKILAISLLQSSLISLFLIVGYFNKSISPIIKHNSSYDINQNSNFLIDLIKNIKYDPRRYFLEEESNTQIIYADPVPSVLMLTAIVVGFCVSSLGFAFIIAISKFEKQEAQDSEE